MGRHPRAQHVPDSPERVGRGGRQLDPLLRTPLGNCHCQDRALAGRGPQGKTPRGIPSFPGYASHAELILRLFKVLMGQS